MAGGIIIEGVTGAGKSRTLAALTRHEAWAGLLNGGRLVEEDETLGEVMGDLADPGMSDDDRCVRLRQVWDEVRAAPASAGFVLERFHPSYYAIMPDWRLYDALDADLAGMGFRLVLLQVPESRVVERSLERCDRSAEEWTQGMIAFWGSKERAVEAILTSQRRRQACLAWTRLPSLVIDTAAGDWSAYADQIVRFAQTER